MIPEDEITKYLNTRYDKFKSNVIEILCKFLGRRCREYITDVINNVEIVYFVNRINLNYCLNSGELDDNENKLLEYFLDKMDAAENLNFNEMNINELIKYLENQSLSEKEQDNLNLAKIAWEIIQKLGEEASEEEKTLEEQLRVYCKIARKTSSKHHILGTYGKQNTEKDFGYRCCSFRTSKINGKRHTTIALPIYSIGFSPDSEYFWVILESVLAPLREPGDLHIGNINLGEKVYNKIIYYFSIIFTNRLHKENIFIFDNKNLTRNEDKYRILKDNEVFQKIKVYFSSLFLRFLLEPNKVMELVGKDNFKKFALWLVYLAPRLETDYLELDEEFETLDAIDIPYDELDIDIMEVLDDMYLEYLKHQDISLTMIDTKKIMEAKAVLARKKERDRIEKKHDSQYYDITLVFKYLENYGNCQVRFFSHSKTCYMLDFRINKEGTLSITKNMEIYNKPPFTYNGDFDETAKLKSSIKVLDYHEDDYSLIMAFILYYSLNNNTAISTNRDLHPSTVKDISKLYDVTLPMYSLNLQDIALWFQSSASGALNMLLGLKNHIEEQHTPAIIECKTKILSQKLQVVGDVWSELNKATNETEYQKASTNWDNLKNGNYSKKA